MHDIVVKVFWIFLICFLSGVLLYYVNELIAKVLSKIPLNNSNTSNTSNTVKNGKIIGFLERILYFVGIISQNWVLITIVVAFKTISRYKEIDEQINSEYFLIGSLLSLIFSLVISGLFIGVDILLKLEIVQFITNLVNYNVKIL